MREKEVAVMLVDMANKRLEEIRNLYEQITDLDNDFVYYADKDDMDEAMNKLDEVFRDVYYGIKRFG